MLIVATLGLMLVVGCGESFKDEAEEHAYLSALSNPTPSQFKRRRELDAKKAERDEAEAGRMRAAQLASDRRAAAGELAEARRKSKASKSAGSVVYREIIERYPDTDEARQAREELEELGRYPVTPIKP
jgi:hypothetical protein